MYNESGKKPKFTLVTVIAVAAVMLVAATTEMAITGYAFAYNRNQATSAAANDCGNGQVPTNIGCQNTNSQIQGDENSVALSSQQTFPSEPPSQTGFNVEGTGTGTSETFTCDPSVAPGLTFIIDFSAQNDGTVSGTYTLTVIFNDRVLTVEEGTLTDGSTDGSTFSLTGERFSICADTTDEFPFGEVTISGNCGEGVTITYRDPATEASF